MFAYSFLRGISKPIQWACVPTTILHAERLPTDGPLLIAPTHISHLEPFVISLAFSIPIRWMARTEFFSNRVSDFAMKAVGSFSVHRQGWTMPGLRVAMDLLAKGRCVGVFPEAGVSRRQYSAMRGGPIKHGACFLALHTQTPVIPIAVVGTHAMNHVKPWLPCRRAPLRIAVGEPIDPGPCPSGIGARRRRRLEMGEELRLCYPRLYQELLELPGVDDRHDLYGDEPDDPARVCVDPYAASGALARRQVPGISTQES